MQFRSESIVDFKLAQMQSACVLKTTTCNIEKTLIDMRREMNIYKTVWRATIRQSTVIDDALTAATNSRLHNKQNQWHCCRRRLLLLTAGSDIEHHRWLICDVEVGYLLVRLQLSSGSRQQMLTDWRRCTSSKSPEYTSIRSTNQIISPTLLHFVSFQRVSMP